jgi:hypothetical protein
MGDSQSLGFRVFLAALAVAYVGPARRPASRDLDVIAQAKRSRPAWLPQEQDTIQSRLSLSIQCLTNRRIRPVGETIDMPT